MTLQMVKAVGVRPLCEIVVMGQPNHTTNRNQPSPKDPGVNRMPTGYWPGYTRLHKHSYSVTNNYTRPVT